MDTLVPAVPAADKGAIARAIMAGLFASLVGIGLARFAYTPLIPALIDARWFSSHDVVYLGAANLVGYLAGAVAGRAVARRAGARRTLQLMMLAASLAFFACAFPLSVSWFFAWRFLSGVAGGIIMVLAASTVLPHIPANRRGLGGGAIFLGVGLGVAASGTLGPVLMEYGLRATWGGLGLLSLLLTALSWHCWPRDAHADGAPPVRAGAKAPLTLELKLLYLQYGLMAVGLVPMMVFLVDYVARGLNMGTHEAAKFWVVYGLGAIAGPMLYGAVADRIGPAPTSRIATAVQAAAIAVLVLSGDHGALLVATFISGTFPPGVVPLTLARLHQALPGDVQAQGAAWSRATTIFALFQALAGYGYSYLFAASSQDHRLLLAVGGWTLVFGLALDGALLWWRRAARPARRV